MIYHSLMILSGRRAQAILLPLIMRRTKDSKLEGKPILDLKPKHIDIITLKFSDEEQEVCICSCAGRPDSWPSQVVQQLPNANAASDQQVYQGRGTGEEVRRREYLLMPG